MAFASALALGCSDAAVSKTDTTAVADTPAAVDTCTASADDTTGATRLENEVATDGAATTADEPKPAPKKSQGSPAPSYGGKETLYISTYGANGKVWGHVTMNGKTGRGTIHDDDENSYSITVTRHGGELFGTDQNGRQYVFQL